MSLWYEEDCGKLQLPLEYFICFLSIWYFSFQCPVQALWKLRTIGCTGLGPQPKLASTSWDPVISLAHYWFLVLQNHACALSPPESLFRFPQHSLRPCLFLRFVDTSLIILQFWLLFFHSQLAPWNICKVPEKFSPSFLRACCCGQWIHIPQTQILLHTDHWACCCGQPIHTPTHSYHFITTTVCASYPVHPVIPEAHGL